MTTNINLLPWREWRRKKAQRDFITQLVLAVLLGIVVWGAWHKIVSANIQAQEQRIAYIEKRISKLNEKIEKIDHLKEQRAKLIKRMTIIQQLQGNRPTIVYLFDQLVRTLPEGVYYTSIERNGKTFTLKGVAQSNNRISRLMRNLEASPWFRAPDLQSVRDKDDQQSNGGSSARESEASVFTLTVKQESNDKKDGEAGKGNGGNS